MLGVNTKPDVDGFLEQGGGDAIGGRSLASAPTRDV
jgi:hypothetical protein